MENYISEWVTTRHKIYEKLSLIGKKQEKNKILVKNEIVVKCQYFREATKVSSKKSRFDTEILICNQKIGYWPTF